MMTNIVNTDGAKLAIGQPVRVALVESRTASACHVRAGLSARSGT